MTAVKHSILRASNGAQSFTSAWLWTRAKPCDSSSVSLPDCHCPFYLQLGWVMWRCLLTRGCQTKLWLHRDPHVLSRCRPQWLSTKQSYHQAPPGSLDSEPASSHEGQDWSGAYEDEEVQDGLQSSSPELNLPLSPLMDPKLIAARERHRNPKPAPGENQSEFSKKLRNNPYGEHTSTRLLG